MENNKRLQALFKRYLDRSCSPEEVKELLVYFDQDTETSGLRTLIMAELAVPSQPAEVTAEREKIVDRVQQNLNFHIENEPKQERIPSLIRKYLLPVAVAASFAGLVALAYFYREAIVNFSDPVHQRELVTNRGERKRVRLPDGSQIWLSPGSRLSYPDKFRGETREVSIFGQAFFDVSTDKAHPFIVKSGHLKTYVLGTSFNVTAYETDKEMSVTLLSGKVRVISNTGQVDMQPNQRLVYNTQNGDLHTENDPDAQRFLQQRKGILTYEGTRLATVVSELERTFELKIQLDDRMKDCLFNGSFKATDKPEIAIQQVALPFNASFKKLAAGNYVITGRGCF